MNTSTGKTIVIKPFTREIFPALGARKRLQTPSGNHEQKEPKDCEYPAWKVRAKQLHGEIPE